jgi:hypothetical protein
MFNTECPTCAIEGRCSDEAAFCELVFRAIASDRAMPECPGHRTQWEKGGEVISPRSSRSPHPSRGGIQKRYCHELKGRGGRS